MTRVTDLAQFNTAMFYLNQTRMRITDEQSQVSSGVKSLTYAGLSPDVNRLITLETAHARVDQYVANNNLIANRLQTMEGNVSQMFDAATNLKTLLVNALNNNNASSLNLSAQADTELQQVASLLNAKLGSRYLFAGSRTDTLPVDLTQLPASYTIPSADGDSASYYQGDNFVFSIQADDSLTVSYGVTADQGGFEKLIRALDIVKKSPPTDRAALQHALDVVDQAITEIPDIRTGIGTAQSMLDQVNKRHSDFQLYSEKSIGDIQNVDAAELMTRLQADSTSLQASYMALNTLSQMNLLNFLR
jgi:flagellar hook-associated protein 3 FlgL